MIEDGLFAVLSSVVLLLAYAVDAWTRYRIFQSPIVAVSIWTGAFVILFDVVFCEIIPAVDLAALPREHRLTEFLDGDTLDPDEATAATGDPDDDRV